jgi:hypothetical protein
LPKDAIAARSDRRWICDKNFAGLQREIVGE